MWHEEATPYDAKVCNYFVDDWIKQGHEVVIVHYRSSFPSLFLKIAKMLPALRKRICGDNTYVNEAVKELNEQIALNNNTIVKLNSTIEAKQTEMALALKNKEDNLKAIISLKDEEIDRLKDFKSKQSTKMVGETLEVYCMNQFNQIRSFAFPGAYFEKDMMLKAVVREILSSEIMSIKMNLSLLCLK